MIGLRITIPVLIVTALLGLARPASSEEVQLAANAKLLARIQAMEDELAEIQSLPATTPTTTGCCNQVHCSSACDHGVACGETRACCDGYGDVDCGWYFAAEAVIVKPYFEDGVNSSDSEQPFYDLKASPRFWAGYRGPNGLGVRGHYWWLNTESEEVDGEINELQFRTAGLEVTRSVCWGPLTADLFAGARYASVLHQEVDNDPAGARTEGVGVTFGSDFRVPLGDSCLGIVGSLRGSTLFGTSENSGDDLDDVAFFLGETQLGLEYRRCLNSGILSFHVLAEAQSWMAATTSLGNINGIPDEDVALLGVTIGAQFVY